MRTAQAAGAVTVPAGPDQAQQILDLTGGHGVDAAFDLVGVSPTLRTAVAMYRQGQIVPEVERFSLQDAPEAYRRLQAGELSGRAVVVPHAA